MSDRPPVAPTKVLPDLSTTVRRLLVMDLISGIVLIGPLFAPARNTPGFGLLAILLLLPYLMVCWRLLRSPGTKEGPGLAAGIGSVFVLVAALGCAAVISQGDKLYLAYFAGLGLTHALLAGLGLAAFRQGTSTKPIWRVVLRSFIDPIVYYGVILFLALGSLRYH